MSRRLLVSLFIAAGTYTQAFASPAPQSCLVSGREALKEAAESGFRFTIRKISAGNTGDCSLTQVAGEFRIRAVSPNAGEPTTCEVRLFVGRLLAREWEIMRVSLPVVDNGAVQVIRDPGPADPETHLAITADLGHAVFYRPSRVDLKGPNCTRWREAFVSSRMKLAASPVPELEVAPEPEVKPAPEVEPVPVPNESADAR